MQDNIKFSSIKKLYNLGHELTHKKQILRFSFTHFVIKVSIVILSKGSKSVQNNNN